MVILPYNHIMDLQFERGNSNSPRGHAFLLFHNFSDPSSVWVSYVVVMPIAVDLAKYVPPFLMNQVASEINSNDVAAFAFPPAPERIESHEVLNYLADSRDDDVIVAGSFNPGDVSASMILVNEASQKYAEYCKQATSTEVSNNSDELEDGIGVNEVLYSLMNDQDKLDELSKLISTLRFAYDGSDQDLINGTETEINLLALHLPQDHKVPELVEAVKSHESRSARLAELYLQRCFHLVLEQYNELTSDEKLIQEIKSEENGSK